MTAASGGGGSGTLTEITSSDGTISITNPFGPIVDLIVPQGTGVYFDRFPFNTGHTLDCRATFVGGSTGSIHLEAENQIELVGTAGIEIGGSAGLVFSTSISGNTVALQFDTDIIYFSDSAGADILRLIKVAGVWQYHIQTGATWQADL